MDTSFNGHLLISESWHSAGPLFECAVSRRQQDGDCEFDLTLGRQEGMDQRGTDFTAQTYV